MNTSFFKRILSFVLCLALLAGNVPAAVFATENPEVITETAPSTEPPAQPAVIETAAATEAPQPEGTSAPTAAPAEETAAPTEAPVPEETEVPTAPPVPEVSAAPTEVVTDPEGNTLAEEETASVVVSDFQAIVPECDLPENDELFAAYAEQVLYGRAFSFLGTAAGERLTGDEKVLYDALVPIIKQIAGGSRESTVIRVGQKTDGADVDAAFTTENPTREIMLQIIGRVIDALLSDLPYEMYWYDKVTGCAYSYGTLAEKLVTVELHFYVAANYRGVSNTSVNTAKTGAAVEAVSNAQSILSKYAGSSDYKKLAGYSNEICSLVTYNHDAANNGSFSSNDGPWQLIYVFDGDSGTNVVCEGYSKAFMYLCDLSDFTGDVTCYTVTGLLGTGRHMWNIVTFGESNYLVDVTNSDGGSSSSDSGLFLAGGSGSAAAGYTVGSLRYTYDDGTMGLWGTTADSILTLAQEDYVPGPEDIGNTCGENLTWSLDEQTGVLTISGSGAMTEYASMTSVPWYDNRDLILSVVIDEGVTSISKSVFYNYTNLTDVTIASSVKSIATHAFYNCKNLKNVNITDPSAWCKIAFADIQANPMRHAQQLRILNGQGAEVTAVVLDGSVTSIPDFTFKNSSLTSIQIGENVRSIGNYAFSECSGLTSITIPGSVTSIGDNAFYNCTNLATAVLKNGVSSIGRSAFCDCSGLTSVQIPASVTGIGAGAFCRCRKLTSITIPAGVTGIGNNTFTSCTSLISVDIPDSVTSIGSEAFYSCESLERVTIGGGITTIGKDAFHWLDKLTDVYIKDPSAWCKISFDGYANPMAYADRIHVLDADGNEMKAVILDDSVTTIPSNAFKGNSLTSIAIPASVISIGMNAFSGNTGMTDAFYGGTAEQWTALGINVPSAGYLHYSCTDAVSHWKEIEEEATCETAGYTCERCACGYERYNLITQAALGHKEVIDEATNPTCTEPGKTQGSHCAKCGKVFVEQTITAEALGHYVLQNGTERVPIDGMEATCKEDIVCDSCKQVIKPRIDHQYSSIVTAPTCTVDGYTTHTCSGCGDTYTDTPVTAPGHSYKAENDVVTPPTCEDDGYTTHTCSGCGDTYQDTPVTAPGHKEVIDPAIAATCTETGLTQGSHCSVCDEILTAQKTLPYAHNYVSGTCTLCGESSAEQGTCGENVYWKLDEDGILYIYGSGPMSNFWNNQPWRDYQDDIRKVIVDNGVTTIGEAAFQGITRLYYVILGESVTTIERMAFYNCTHLNTISLPKNLKSIKDDAFRACEYLLNVVIPDSVTLIGPRAFFGCERLQYVTFGGGVQTIGASAFQNCIGMQSIKFLGDPPGTGDLAFTLCPATACYPGENALWTQTVRSNIGGNYLSWVSCSDTSALGCDNHLKMTGSREIPSTCVRRGYSAMTYCYYCGMVLSRRELLPLADHTERIVPGIEPTCTEAGTSIGKVCSVCDKVIQEHEPVSAYGHSYDAENKCTRCGGIGGICGEDLAWTFTDQNGILTISGTGAMPDFAFTGAAPTRYEQPWKNLAEDIKSVVIENGVTRIGTGAFTQSGVTHIEIPVTVTSIGNDAFGLCRNLTEIALPGSLVSIGNDAFAYCTGLTDIEIPDTVTAIGDNVFWNCSGLKSMTIPEGVNCIPGNTFYGCSSLTVITIPDSITAIGDAAFYGCDQLTDVYYGGSCEQWTGLGNNAPAADAVHFHCTEPVGHWQQTTVDATCVTEGYICLACPCDYERDKIITSSALGHEGVIDAAVIPTCTQPGMTEGSHCSVCNEVFTAQEEIPALGHEEVIDEAVAPTCTKTGLTEGSHCAACGEVTLQQEEIPVVKHDFAQSDDRIVCNDCGEEVTIRIRQDYLAMDLQSFTQTELEVELSHDYLAEYLQWSLEGDEGIVTVENGRVKVTQNGTGNVYVVATVCESGFMATSRCRVEVAESIQLKGIQLSTDKLTAELFKTDYAGLEILLQLPDYYPEQTASTYSLRRGNTGVMMESARFTSDTLHDLFEIVILDDRSVLVIPRVTAITNALENSKSVKSKYTDSITVTVQGREFTSEPMTLNVKQTKPKLKGTVAAFNSFYFKQSQPIVITGATATGISPDESKPLPTPDWLTLNGDVLTLTEDAPLSSKSGKAYIMVDTEEWAIPAAVTLSVKNTYKAKGLKLSASAVTMSTQTESSAGAQLKLVCTGKSDTLSGLNVTDIKAPDGYRIENFNIRDGSFTLCAPDGFEAETVLLKVSFSDTENTLGLKLKVTPKVVTLKAASTSVTLNRKVSDSARIKVTATPADHRILDPELRLTGTETINGAKTTVDKRDSGELDIRFENGELLISTTEDTPETGTYTLYISSGGSKEVKVTVKVVSADPSVSYKASGSMDLSFPEQAATIKPTFRNYNGKIISYTYNVAEMKGKTVVNEDVSESFHMDYNGTAFTIRCTDEDADTADTYAVKLKLVLEDGSTVENTLNLKVKRTAVKLKLSSSKLTLNKLTGDSGNVTVTCTTKGYGFTEPLWEVTDRNKLDAKEQLEIGCEEGKLTVATNDFTVYGMTYTVNLKANEHGTVSKLTVTIPLEEKSAVTATLKAKNFIDVVRDGTAITLTPTYKNLLDRSEVEETLVFTKTANKVTTDARSLFDYVLNEDGTFTVTKAADAKLDHSGKYKVKLVTYLNDQKLCESKEISISVKMGSAKLTVQTQGTTLFAKDKNDRAVIWFEAKDASLNGVKDITIASAAQARQFEIIPYGNGVFAIGFADGKVDPALVKKNINSVSVKLNVFVKGNETAKASTTATVKLTVVK